MRPASRPPSTTTSRKRSSSREAAKSAKNGPVNADGSFSFAGIDDQYFAAAFLPPPNTTLETTTFDDMVPSPVNSAEEPIPGSQSAARREISSEFISARRRFRALHQVNPKLDGIVDWGWFGIIAKPLFIVLHCLNDKFVHNYGWAIIVLTIIINIALFPLKLTTSEVDRARCRCCSPRWRRSTRSTRASA